MPISVTNRKQLWALSNNQCAFPDCNNTLVTHDLNSGGAVVGIECHIVARKSDGPRGNEALQAGTTVDDISNLILLCPTHHSIIDGDVKQYTVAILRSMKAGHELQAQTEPGNPTEKGWVDVYKSVVDDWVGLAMLDEWRSISGWVLSAPTPRLQQQTLVNLYELQDWHIARSWPGKYPWLESSFDNFLKVLSCFLNQFSQHSDIQNNNPNIIVFDRYYQHIKIFHERQESHINWEFDKALVEDLFVELTRASNYIIDQVRIHVDETFRVREGVLSVEHGPYGDLQHRIDSPKYPDRFRTALPFEGLDDFKLNRAIRDGWAFGVGRSADDPKHRKAFG